MSLALIGAVYLKAVKCPQCGEPIQQTEDYHADIVQINQIGGPPIQFVKGEEVTIVCNKCEWQQRTKDWRSFVKP